MLSIHGRFFNERRKKVSEKYLKRLEELVNQIENLKKESVRSSKFIKWKKSTDLTLRAIFDNDDWSIIKSFYEIDFVFDFDKWGNQIGGDYLSGLEEAKNVLEPIVEHLKIEIEEPEIDYSKVIFLKYVAYKLRWIKKLQFWKKDFWKHPIKAIVYILGAFATAIIVVYVNKYFGK